MPKMPDGVSEGIIRGLYRAHSTDSVKGQKTRPQLFGSGPILNEVLRAQAILSDKFGIGSDVWSVTSYSELCRDASMVTRWNRLHPTDKPRVSYLESTLDGLAGPFIAASDNVRLVPDQIRAWIPGSYHVLGTDGFGRSETRQELRRHFEIDAECVAYTTLVALAQEGHFDKKKLPKALKDLGIDPEKVEPLKA
jgi:pyruvate dehydrogenase E1 component